MATAEQIKQAYIDIKGSAADDAGLAYWQSTGDDILKIRDDIARVTKADNEAWLGNQYQSILGQTLGQEGKDYWLGEGGLSEDTTGHGDTFGSRASVIENLKLHKAAMDDGDDGDGDDGDDGDDTLSTVDVGQVQADTLADITNATNQVQTVDTSGFIDHDSTSGINQIDTSQILADIAAAQGDIHSLQGKFSSLGGIDPEQVKSIVDSTYGQQLKDLDSTYSQDIGDLQTQLGDLSTKTTQQRVDLEKALGDASSMFSTRLDNMQTTWNKSLKDQQTSFGSSLAKQGSDFDQKLKDISANMDYRMLDDNAAGVKMRRSKAFTQGRTSRGTSQLGRGMRIKSLNI